MSRETYKGPSPETESALRDRVKDIAGEMQKSRQYLDAILAGTASDPFIKHLKIFRAVCRKNPQAAPAFIARQSAIFREETGRGRAGGAAAFPSALIHRVWEREVNTAEAGRVPFAERVADLDQLLGELAAYRDGLAEGSRGAAASGNRADLGEVNTTTPGGRAAASG